MNKLEANKAILKLLGELMEKNPDLRFNQLVTSLNLFGEDKTTTFYKESEDTLKMFEHFAKKMFKHGE